MAEKLAENQRTGTTTTTTTRPEETLVAINLLIRFFFREVQNHGLVRRFLIKRINKEMQEGLQKGGAAVNKIIKGLKVRGRIQWRKD